jgi:hypothetical protein
VEELILLQGTAQRFALPALGRGRRSRPARKMIRRVKLLGMCAESPASGARFVSRLPLVWKYFQKILLDNYATWYQIVL